VHSISLFDAVILGLVEGVTEYLPVSSTGHLILTSALLGLDEPPERKAAVDAFNIVIQGGAILAVLGLYRHRVARMIAGLLGRDPEGRRLAGLLSVAFLPAAILGPLLDDAIEQWLFRPVPVLAALALGGVMMIAITPWQRRRLAAAGDAGEPGDEADDEDFSMLSWRQALVIGLLQCLAMWPGTSRSMATIVGGMLVGLRPRHAAEFSFLLGLPTLGGACVYTAAKSLTGDGPSFLEVLGPGPIVAGLVVATISAALAVRWLVGFLARHGVSAFGWYRLGLCAVLGALMLANVVRLGPPA